MTQWERTLYYFDIHKVILLLQDYVGEASPCVRRLGRLLSMDFHLRFLCGLGENVSMGYDTRAAFLPHLDCVFNVPLCPHLLSGSGSPGRPFMPRHYDQVFVSKGETLVMHGERANKDTAVAYHNLLEALGTYPLCGCAEFWCTQRDRKVLAEGVQVPRWRRW